MKKIFLIAGLLTICAPALAQTYTVERVIDGNTIKLTNGETVRLIGIDTPEYKPNDKVNRDAERTGQDLETITKMGKEATKFLQSLFDGKGYNNKHIIILKYDVQKKDKYGRILAYAFMPQLSADGEILYEDDVPIELFLNAYLVMQGYASPMIIPPNVKYADLFQKLYEEAMESGRGLWSNDMKGHAEKLELKYDEEYEAVGTVRFRKGYSIKIKGMPMRYKLGWHVPGLRRDHEDQWVYIKFIFRKPTMSFEDLDEHDQGASFELYDNFKVTELEILDKSSEKFGKSYISRINE